MDDFTAELLAGAQDDNSPPPSPVRARDPTLQTVPEAEPPSTPHRSGFRGGFAAIREKANLQDRLVEKSASPPGSHALTSHPRADRSLSR